MSVCDATCRRLGLDPTAVPANPANDIDLVEKAFIGRVVRVVGGDTNARWVAGRNVLDPFGHQPHAVMQDEKPWRIGRLAPHIDQDRIPIIQCGHHAVPSDAQDPEVFWVGLQLIFNPGQPEMVEFAGLLILGMDDRSPTRRSLRLYARNADEGRVR